MTRRATVESAPPAQTDVLALLPLEDPFWPLEEACLLSNSPDVLARHQRVLQQETLDSTSPYYEFVGTAAAPFFHFERNGLRVRTGPIGAFSGEVMAAWIQTMAQTYAVSSTLGDFPQEDLGARRELLVALTTGFSPHHLFHLVSKGLDEGGEVIIGGCMIVPGQREETVVSLVGDERATLSTLSSLKFSLPPEVWIGSVPESQLVGFSRFFRLPNAACAVHGVSKEDIYHAIVESIIGASLAYQVFGQAEGRVFKGGIADISDPRLVRVIRPVCGGQVLTDSVRPTPLVMATIHRHHYGVYQDQIRVLCFEAESQWEMAGAASVDLGEALPLNV